MSNIERIISKNYKAFTGVDKPKSRNVAKAEESDTEETKTVSTPFNEEKFWRIIESLGWRNIDERKFTASDIKITLDGEKINYIKDHIPTVAEHVESAIRPLGWFNNANDNEIKNFTYHVVALGHQQYLATIFDPEFTQFIWDTQPKIYQDLYDMLTSINN